MAFASQSIWQGYTHVEIIFQFFQNRFPIGNLFLYMFVLYVIFAFHIACAKLY